MIFPMSRRKKRRDLMEREKKGGRAHFFDVDIFFLCCCCSPLNIYPKKSKGDFSIGMKKRKKNEKHFFGWDKNSADVTWEIPLGSS